MSCFGLDVFTKDIAGSAIDPGSFLLTGEMSFKVTIVNLKLFFLRKKVLEVLLPSVPQ